MKVLKKAQNVFVDAYSQSHVTNVNSLVNFAVWLNDKIMKLMRIGIIKTDLECKQTDQS